MFIHHTTEYQLNKGFGNLCEWFKENNLSIHLGEDRKKCILFGLTHIKLKSPGKLNIMSNGIEIRQYSKITYLGCLLDETMPGESMALKTIKKINLKLKFLYSPARILRHTLHAGLQPL